jgi:hypothetical protein
LASYLLRKLGLHVLVLPDVEDALRVLQQTRARVHIAVLYETEHQKGSSLERLRTVVPLRRVLVVTDGQESDRSHYLERARIWACLSQSRSVEPIFWGLSGVSWLRLQVDPIDLLVLGW